MKFIKIMTALLIYTDVYAAPNGQRLPYYNPDDYYIDYLTPTERGKALIVYENIHTGHITKFLVKTEDLQDDETIRMIKIKVAEENAK